MKSPRRTKLVPTGAKGTSFLDHLAGRETRKGFVFSEMKILKPDYANTKFATTFQRLRTLITRFNRRASGKGHFDIIKLFLADLAIGVTSFNDAKSFVIGLLLSYNKRPPTISSHSAAHDGAHDQNHKDDHTEHDDGDKPAT